jgi:hypothetical protein
VPLLRERRRPLTFVMHTFMDTRDVRPAWDALRRGELVPACVQHALLDPHENLRLRELLLLNRG